MNAKLRKNPSIEMFGQNQSSTQIIETQQQYITNLQSENKYKKSALSTAEDLIRSYQLENQILKQQKQKMEIKISKLQHKVELLQNILIKQQTKNRASSQKKIIQPDIQKQSNKIAQSHRYVQNNLQAMQFKMEKLLLKQELYEEDIKNLKRQMKYVHKNQKNNGKLIYNGHINYDIPLHKLTKQQSNENNASQNQYLKMVLKLDRRKRIKTVTGNYLTPTKKLGTKSIKN